MDIIIYPSVSSIPLDRHLHRAAATSPHQPAQKSTEAMKHGEIQPKKAMQTATDSASRKLEKGKWRKLGNGLLVDSEVIKLIKPIVHQYQYLSKVVRFRVHCQVKSCGFTQLSNQIFAPSQLMQGRSPAFEPKIGQQPNICKSSKKLGLVREI